PNTSPYLSTKNACCKNLKNDEIYNFFTTNDGDFIPSYANLCQKDGIRRNEKVVIFQRKSPI
ncbi:hypothetical protein IJ556_04695, partial [bacterium]|nr:hypothetical protein [bacterium]